MARGDCQFHDCWNFDLIFIFHHGSVCMVHGVFCATNELFVVHGRRSVRMISHVLYPSVYCYGPMTRDVDVEKIMMMTMTNYRFIQCWASVDVHVRGFKNPIYISVTSCLSCVSTTTSKSCSHRALFCIQAYTVSTSGPQATYMSL